MPNGIPSLLTVLQCDNKENGMFVMYGHICCAFLGATRAVEASKMTGACPSD